MNNENDNNVVIINFEFLRKKLDEKEFLKMLDFKEELLNEITKMINEKNE